MQREKIIQFNCLSDFISVIIIGFCFTTVQYLFIKKIFQPKIDPNGLKGRLGGGPF